MNFIGRLVRLIVLAFFGTLLASAAMAVQRKRTAPPPPDEAADEIELVTIFDQLDFRSTATAFRGGRVECWFGGGLLDLRGATLAPEGAVLEVQAVFGGGSIIVPDDWTVTTRVVGIGGAGDARGNAASGDGPRLEIEGLAVFGGWGIMSDDPRGDVIAAV
jgi:hypothetical protein